MKLDIPRPFIKFDLKVKVLLTLIILCLVGLGYYVGTQEDTEIVEKEWTVKTLSQEAITFASEDVNNPSIVNGWKIQDERSCLLAYDSDRAGDKDIWLSGCEQGAWQPSFDVTSNSSDERMPVIIKINTGGRFALAFISNYTGNRTVFLTKSMDGIDWQVPVQIINDTELKNDELSTLTFILLQDDRGMLAYNAYDSLNNNYELKVVYSVDENLTNWTTPTRVLPPSGDPYSAPHLIQNQSGIITLLYNSGYDVLYTEIDGNTMQIWSQPEKMPLQSTAAATNKFLNPWLIQSKADDRLLVTDSSIQIRPDGDDWKEISNKTNENPVMIEITNTTALLSYKGEGGRIIVEEIQIEEGVPVTDEFDAALFIIFFLLALLIILAIVREIYMD